MPTTRGVEDAKHKDAPAKPRKVAEGWDAAFRGYINLNLTDDQKEGHASWSTSPSVWDALERHTSDGVNLSLKWVAKEECFLASATMRREASPNAGLVVTARGRSAGVAFTRCLYCLEILGEADRWELIQPLADPDRW
jgi:hypothetical protein